jgi:NAD-dependent dihydropyrimidine dehydrogenase PreA subunit
MATKTARKIVKIDESKCNGCGQCVPNCMEGAIRIIDGKARLVGENLCDGLGNCLGTCPMDAITIEERPAEEFDERAVHEHLHREDPKAAPAAAPSVAKVAHAAHQGCPGTMLRQLRTGARPAPAPRANTGSTAAEPRPSQLSQWPVQLSLVPISGPIWQDADVLIAADCVAFAMADFHERLLAGKTLAIACPKLDDVGPYVAKLAAIFAGNDLRSITVAHMEVPCCMGLVYAVRQAIEQAGKPIPFREVTVGIDGTIQNEA